MKSFVEVVQEIKKGFDKEDAIVLSAIEDNTETSLIASSRHAPSTFFVYKKKIYQAVKLIQIGEAIIIGSDTTDPTVNAILAEDIISQLTGISSELATSKFGDFTSVTDVPITIDGVTTTYQTFWKVAPTNSNQVYGLGINPNDGQLYEIYNNEGNYSVKCFSSQIQALTGNLAPMIGAIITPEYYGAVGDGITNDTIAINNMLANCEGKIAVFRGTYLVEGAVNDKYENCGLRIRSNTHIIFAGGSKIIEIPNNTKESHIFNIIGVENVIIEGGEIVGDYLNHTIDSGLTDEWCHGIRILSSKNVTVKDMKISECFGDGIYVGQCESADVITVPTDNHCRNVTIENVIIDHAGRNGISLCDCSGWTIDNCKMYRITRTAPASAIDIEREGSFTPSVSSGTLNNCHSENCTYGAKVTSCANSIIIANCSLNKSNIYNNSAIIYFTNNVGGLEVYETEVVISNCNIGLFISAGSKKTKMINCKLTVYQATGIGFKTVGELIDCIIDGIYNFDHDMTFKGCRFVHDGTTGYCLRLACANAILDGCVFELKGYTSMNAINDATTNKLTVINCHCDGDTTAISRALISATRAPLANGNNYAPFNAISSIVPISNCINFSY